jgi:hypothetical protein
MRLEHLYRLRFSYVEHWEVAGPDPRFFGLAEGRCEGAIAGIGRPREDGGRQVGATVTHLSGDERYARLNDAVCVLTGESRDKELVLDVAELVWEPLAD